MSLEIIKNKIKTKMLEVAMVGNVYDYLITTDVSPDKFIELYGFRDELRQYAVRTWFITRSATSEAIEAMRKYRRRYTFTITGYMSAQEDIKSEQVFQNLIENIIENFRGDDNLGGVALQVSPMQVTNVSFGFLGEVGCHTCNLTIEVDEQKF